MTATVLTAVDAASGSENTQSARDPAVSQNQSLDSEYAAAEFNRSSVTWGQCHGNAIGKQRDTQQLNGLRIRRR